ncbi:MAG: lysine 2,3-aminomutase, partial [Chloroflexota bacterium]
MPTPSRRAKFYADVPDEKWFDWRWQMSNRLNTVGELANVLDLSESERKALEAKSLFRVDVTPYFASLIDPEDPHDPIRQQIVPTDREMAPFSSMMEDSLAEDRHSP